MNEKSRHLCAWYTVRALVRQVGLLDAAAGVAGLRGVQSSQALCVGARPLLPECSPLQDLEKPLSSPQQPAFILGEATLPLLSQAPLGEYHFVRITSRTEKRGYFCMCWRWLVCAPEGGACAVGICWGWLAGPLPFLTVHSSGCSARRSLCSPPPGSPRPGSCWPFCASCSTEVETRSEELVLASKQWILIQMLSAFQHPDT